MQALDEIDSTVPMTAFLAAQSGGHPVKKIGYFEKRGINAYSKFLIIWK
jgi:hypothetical protein